MLLAVVLLADEAMLLTARAVSHYAASETRCPAPCSAILCAAHYAVTLQAVELLIETLFCCSCCRCLSCLYSPTFSCL